MHIPKSKILRFLGYVISVFIVFAAFDSSYAQDVQDDDEIVVSIPFGAFNPELNTPVN